MHDAWACRRRATLKSPEGWAGRALWLCACAHPSLWLASLSCARCRRLGWRAEGEGHSEREVQREEELAGCVLVRRKAWRRQVAR